MQKIQEIIVEPSKIVAGSTFKLKIKAIRYATFNELKTKTFNEVKNYTFDELKGE